MHTLKTLGWNNYFQQHLNSLQIPNGVASKVVGAQRNIYTIRQEGQPELLATVDGKFRHNALFKSDFPVIGDWVVATPREGENRATITHLLPRQTKLSRQIALSDRPGHASEEQIMASNVDIVFIVSSLNQDLNLRRLERYMTMVSESGARPVILLTKADLCDDVEAKVNDVKSVVYSTPVHAISAHDEVGQDIFIPYLLEGQTSVLVGSSGAGKSTLINWLVGEHVAKVNAIREDDDKGRHTTTNRDMFFLPQGAMIIDTPGIRGLQIEDTEAVESTFDDVTSLETQCRFSNCKHESEPGCAVKAAIETGDLDAERLRNYNKLSNEIAFFDMKDSREDSTQFRRKVRKIQKERSKAIRHHFKEVY